LGRIAIFIGSWLLSRKDSFFWGTQNETAFFEVIEDIFLFQEEIATLSHSGIDLFYIVAWLASGGNLCIRWWVR
jgi:hypothetical protein